MSKPSFIYDERSYGWHLQNPCGTLTVYRGLDDSQLQFYRTIWECKSYERSVTKGHRGLLNGWFGCLKCRHLERGRTVNCGSPCDLDFTAPWNRLLMSAKGISNQTYDFILANNRSLLAWPVDAVGCQLDIAFLEVVGEQDPVWMQNSLCVTFIRAFKWF